MDARTGVQTPLRATMMILLLRMMVHANIPRTTSTATAHASMMMTWTVFAMKMKWQVAPMHLLATTVRMRPTTMAHVRTREQDALNPSATSSSPSTE